MTVELGKAVPEFSLPATGDQTLALSDFKGKNIALYFYPRDNTPGCTQEGIDFQAKLEDFEKANTVVLGISRDTVRKHENFRAKYDYTFDLLADVDETVCLLFNVMRDKKMYGKDVRGIERSTFLIDADGVLVKEWRKVKIEGHVDEVLEAAQAI